MKMMTTTIVAEEFYIVLNEQNKIFKLRILSHLLNFTPNFYSFISSTNVTFSFYPK